MGAELYWYFTKHRGNVEGALQDLREREFKAGRYNPVIPFPSFPVGPESPSPGARHASIEEARAAAGEDGTRSILDLDHVSDDPEFFGVCPVEEDILLELFDTTHPTREMLERNINFVAFMEEVERGCGVYVVLYKDGEPDEVFFGGWSFD